MGASEATEPAATSPEHTPISGRRRPFFSGRLYYGWVQVYALSFTQLISWGILYYAFSVLLVPMGDDLGWSRTQMTGAFSVALFTSGVAGIPVGRWIDAHGARSIMTAGSILGTLLVLAWAHVDSLPIFYVIWFGIGLTMATVLYEPAFALIAVWFRRRRGRALMILTFFGGLASVVFLPLTNWLVERGGWREALIILAAILATTTILPHGLLLRRRPADLGLKPDGERLAESLPGSASKPATNDIPLADALRHSAFWWISGSFALLGGSTTALMVHLIPYLQDQGFSAAFAATVTGAIGLLKLPGRIMFEPLSARLPQHVVAGAIFLLHAIAMMVLALAETRTMVLSFVALFSAGYGAATLVRATIVADVFGIHAYASISGTIGFISRIAAAAGPTGVSLLVAWWGGYTPVLWLLTALIFTSTITILFAREPRTAT